MPAAKSLIQQMLFCQQILVNGFWTDYHVLPNRRCHRCTDSSSGNDCGEENEMTNPYKKILKQLEDTQSELAEIENYDEGAYQAIQKAINYFEYEILEEDDEK